MTIQQPSMSFMIKDIDGLCSLHWKNNLFLSEYKYPIVEIDRKLARQITQLLFISNLLFHFVFICYFSFMTLPQGNTSRTYESLGMVVTQ